jgi:hypothetical protein
MALELRFQNGYQEAFPLELRDSGTQRAAACPLPIRGRAEAFTSLYKGVKALSYENITNWP